MPPMPHAPAAVQRGQGATRCLLPTMESGCLLAVSMASLLDGCGYPLALNGGGAVAMAFNYAGGEQAEVCGMAGHAALCHQEAAGAFKLFSMLPISDTGADVGPEERASTAGSPFAFEGDKVAAGGLGEWAAFARLKACKLNKYACCTQACWASELHCWAGSGSTEAQSSCRACCACWAPWRRRRPAKLSCPLHAAATFHMYHCGGRGI